MARKPQARRARPASDLDDDFGGGPSLPKPKPAAEPPATPPAKSSPDYPFYKAATSFQKVVVSELETRESEIVNCEMRQTKAREKRIHLLKLTAAKLKKIRKMWDGDPTPDLPVTE